MDKKNGATTKKIDSDFEHLKVWQNNPNLDYYLSEGHWNHHVNTALYRLLFLFYDDIGVYEYLKRPLTNDKDLFYGIMLNEAYRLCQIVLTTPVPDAKVAMLFHEAETLSFRDWKIPAEHQPPLPNFVDHILSYHILGMINAILSLANDQRDDIDRFLYNLSLFNDEGEKCYGKHQSFKTYYKQYEQFVVVGLIFSSALRPGYDYKGQDEHLRKTIVWYKFFAEELEKKKLEAETKEPTNIQEQNNYNSQVFNGPVTISIHSSEAQMSVEKLRSDKQKKKRKIEIKSHVQPKTLKYYKHGNNGVLMKQRKRVDIIFRLWNEWGWIDDQTTPDDFDSFFAGEPRHCNITWKANSTILTILLQKLINQPYIEKQTGCAAKSLVEQQFGKTANSDRKRLVEDSEVKIRLTLLVLDINNPLPERNGRDRNEDINIQEAALMEIFAGQLRSTKGI